MTMDFDATLSHVQQLLTLLPGVEISLSGESQIVMAVRTSETLALLAYISAAANLRVLVVSGAALGRRYGEVLDPETLRYVLRFPKESDTDQRPSGLEIMGIYLARELKARGLLDPEESARLQVAWHG